MQRCSYNLKSNPDFDVGTSLSHLAHLYFTVRSLSQTPHNRQKWFEKYPDIVIAKSKGSLSGDANSITDRQANWTIIWLSPPESRITATIYLQVFSQLTVQFNLKIMHYRLSIAWLNLSKIQLYATQQHIQAYGATSNSNSNSAPTYTNSNWNHQYKLHSTWTKSQCCISYYNKSAITQNRS